MSTQRATQLIDAGHWLQMCGDLEGARRLYEQALKLDPDNVRARSLLDSAAPAPVPAVPAQTPDLPPPAEEVPQIPPVLDDADWGEEIVVAEEVAGAEEIVVAEELEASPTDEIPDPEMSWAPLSQPLEQGPSDPNQAGTNAWESNSNPGVHVNALKPGVGAAMDMVSVPVMESSQEMLIPRAGAQPDQVQFLLRGARELLELDDHSGAMDLILKARELAPDDAEVERMRVRSERTLQVMFESRIGEMAARPRVLLPDDDIIWLNLDHRAGFVLAQIDGTVSFEDLFEVCGMSRFDTARILAQLVDEGVISGRV